MSDIYRNTYGSDKPQTVKLASLQDDKYTLIQNENDLDCLLSDVGMNQEWIHDITGAVIWIVDGDYSEVWLSESANWFALSADYHNLAYYL